MYFNIKNANAQQTYLNKTSYTLYWEENRVLS